MPTVTADDIADVTAAVARRWRAIDPLLPAPGAPAGGCGAELTVTGPDGRLAGRCRLLRALAGRPRIIGADLGSDEPVPAHRADLGAGRGGRT